MGTRASRGLSTSYTIMDGETMQKSFDDILNGKGGHKKDFEITPEASFFLVPRVASKHCIFC